MNLLHSQLVAAVGRGRQNPMEWSTQENYYFSYSEVAL